MLLCKQTNVTRQNDEMSAASKMTGHKASPSDMQAVGHVCHDIEHHVNHG